MTDLFATHDPAVGEQHLVAWSLQALRWFRTRCTGGHPHLDWEEMESVAFAAAARAWNTYRSETEASYRSWLWFCVLQSLHAEARRQDRLARDIQLDALIHEDEERMQTPLLINGHTHTEREALQTIGRQQLRALVAALPERSRVCLELYYWQGWTSPLIADHLGITAGAVRDLRARAVAALRRRLTPDACLLTA